jgi:GT2 family glycosyltransferase
MKIVIPSGSQTNLEKCLAAIRKNEPGIPDCNIIVVADGILNREVVTWIDGPKPFIFSRNVNIGIQAANDDVIVLGDDGILETFHGFTKMLREAKLLKVGICSAAIRGLVGNLRQEFRADLPKQMRYEEDFLCFVCVLILRSTIEKIGLMDERFVGYGFDDNAYCRRARKAGITLGTYFGCVIEHQSLPSVYRTRPDIGRISEENSKIYKELGDAGN